MKKNNNSVLKILYAFFAVVFLNSCISLNFQKAQDDSGHVKTSSVDPYSMNQLSEKQYDLFVDLNKELNNTDEGRLVQKVGERLASGLSRYFAQTGRSHLLKDYQWQFILVEDSKAHLWCMPGGRMVVYSGLTSKLKKEEELASVMAHALAHSVLKHDFDLMSESLTKRMDGISLRDAMIKDLGLVNSIFNSIYGSEPDFKSIPRHSKRQEYDADELSLNIMAMTGYDPTAAVHFWKSLPQSSALFAYTKYYSAHIASKDRLDKMEKSLNKAMKNFKPYSK